MHFKLNRRVFTLALPLLSAVGCSRFVWNEDPFTPDPAPATEIIASPGDTTYVLHGSSYYLLAPQREALWNRAVMDDVAWRYRALFRESPPTIAIRLDTAGRAGDTAKTWRDVPLAIAAPARVVPSPARSKRDPEALAEDSIRMRMIVGPLLAATAARAWLDARVHAARESDSRPGGSEAPSSGNAALPAWIDAGVARLLGNASASDRANAQLRSSQKGIIPLDSLFGVAWHRRPNAMDVVETPQRQLDAIDADGGGHRQGRIGTGVPGVSHLFVSQAVSVLGFIRERDPALVGRLADELARGTPVARVLASSTTLPHDVAAVDAEWRNWLKRSARRR
jgi:hypothetical protein